MTSLASTSSTCRSATLSIEPAATDPLVQAVEAAVARRHRRRRCRPATTASHRSRGCRRMPAFCRQAMRPRRSRSDPSRRFETNGHSDDRVAAYSSRGPTWYEARAKPDLVAPGHGLVAAAAKLSTLYIRQPWTQSRRVLSAAQRHEHGDGGRKWNCRPHPGGQSRCLPRRTSDAECREGHPSVHGVARARRSRRRVRRAHPRGRQRQSRRRD